MSATAPQGWTRRDWIRAGLLAGTGVGAGALGFLAYSNLFPSVSPPNVKVRANFVYTPSPSPTWWNRLAGEDVRVTDFQEWQGATAVMNGRFRDGDWIIGTGFPALIIRVKRESQYFQAPPDAPLLSGYSLYFDDPARDLRIVALFDRSTHLCCYPEWHAPRDVSPSHKFIAPCPTYEVFGQEPISDICHGGLWDPLILEWALNPRVGKRYVGARMVAGPGFGPLPSLFVRADQGVLDGAILDPDWYSYCG